MAEAAPIVADDSPASPESANKLNLGEEKRFGGLLCQSDDKNNMPATMHERSRKRAHDFNKAELISPKIEPRRSSSTLRYCDPISYID